MTQIVGMLGFGGGAGAAGAAGGASMFSKSNVLNILQGTASVFSAVSAIGAGIEEQRAANEEIAMLGLEAKMDHLAAETEAGRIRKGLADAMEKTSMAYAASGVDASFGSAKVQQSHLASRGDQALKVNSLNRDARQLAIMRKQMRLQSEGSMAVAKGYMKAGEIGVGYAMDVVERG